MKNNDLIFKRYAVHSFLWSFTQSLLVTFGVLFIYAKTQSIGIALLAELGNLTGDFIVRSPLINWIWNSVLKRRIILAMTVGIIITSVTSVGIFFVDTTATIVVPLLILLSLINSIGTSIYWLPSNAVFFRIVGNSNTPGKHASFIKILRIFAAILAAGVGIFLNATNAFLLLLPFLAIMGLFSLVPLMGLYIPVEKSISWLRSVKRMSVQYFLANFVGDNQLKNTGVPLLLIALFGSLSKSAFISATTLLAAAFLGYFSGKLKDDNKNSIFIISLIGGIFVWFAYSIMGVSWGFIILGALEYVFSTIINIGRDARLGRSAANNGHYLESALAADVARVSGNFVGWIFLFCAYLIFDTLPQFILIAGILFIIPRGLYATGVLEKLRIKKTT